jgi:Glycosyltransferase family 28 N-terminal domain
MPLERGYFFMSYIQGEGRSQGTLFPVVLDDLIPADHVCRVLDAFVTSLAMADLGFERAEAAETGRPGYDLLKLYLYTGACWANLPRGIRRMSKLFEAKRIVIATIGSLGDLHPCLALSLELTRRGHHVTIATTHHYRPKVEALGISFQPMRPDWDPTDPQLIRQCDDLKKGPEVLYRKMLLPELRGTYTDLLSVARHADLLIAGELVYAAPLVAEKLKLPWVSAILSPFSFFSSFDPSVMVNALR